MTIDEKTITDLPLEIVVKILFFLDFKSFKKAAASCQTFQAAADTYRSSNPKQPCIITSFFFYNEKGTFTKYITSIFMLTNEMKVLNELMKRADYMKYISEFQRSNPIKAVLGWLIATNHRESQRLYVELLPSEKSICWTKTTGTLNLSCTLVSENRVVNISQCYSFSDEILSALKQMKSRDLQLDFHCKIFEHDFNDFKQVQSLEAWSDDITAVGIAEFVKEWIVNPPDFPELKQTPAFLDQQPPNTKYYIATRRLQCQIDWNELYETFMGSDHFFHYHVDKFTGRVYILPDPQTVVNDRIGFHIKFVAQMPSCIQYNFVKDTVTVTVIHVLTKIQIHLFKNVAQN